MEYRQTNNSHTRGARVHAYAVRGLLRPLRWGYASLLVLELCFTVRADIQGAIKARSVPMRTVGSLRFCCKAGYFSSFFCAFR